MKETKRKAFNFLRSYFDVFNELETDKDRLEFLTAIINKQFLNEEPVDMSFIVNLCYQSQRHQIESSVKGWERATKDTLSTTPPTTPPRDPREEEEKGEEEEKEVDSATPKGEGFDFLKLLEHINTSFGRKFLVVNQAVRAKYKARLKDGYTKVAVMNAIKNCVDDPHHRESNYKYCTPEFFSRAGTLDLHSEVKETKQKNPMYG